MSNVRSSHYGREIRVAWAIAVKDMRTYYTKPPSLMFGILFPFSLFLSFSIGRNMPLATQIPILISQTLFFASSSIGPVVIPMERANQTFDRFLTSPVSLFSTSWQDSRWNHLRCRDLGHTSPSWDNFLRLSDSQHRSHDCMLCVVISRLLGLRNNVRLDSRPDTRASHDASQLRSHTLAFHQRSLHTDRRAADMDAGSVNAFTINSYR